MLILICKWYSIIFTSLALFLNIYKIIFKETEKSERIGIFIGLLLYIPVMYYLICN